MSSSKRVLRKKEAYYPWSLRTNSAKDYLDRVPFLTREVSRDGLVFDPDGSFRAPTLRINKKGKITQRRLRFYVDKKPREYSYDRFVYAAWNQDTFDIDDVSMVVRRVNPTAGGHLDNLEAVPRIDMLTEIADSIRTFTLEEEELIKETWESADNFYTKTEFAARIGTTPDVLNRIIGARK